MAGRKARRGGGRATVFRKSGEWISQTLFTSQIPSQLNGNDGESLTVGTRFTPDIDGKITGVRIYRATTSPTSLIVLLYTNAGAELARTTIASPTTGWNTGTFTTPVDVSAATVYVAAYFSNGPYTSSPSVLPITNYHLTSSESRWIYGASATFPTNVSSAGTTYFADPVFLYYSNVVATPGCDRNATDASTLAIQVAAATAGQTICLAAGNYGVWDGVNKAITIKAAPGVVANMTVNLDSDVGGFTLDGLSGMGGVVPAGAHDFTIRNCTFTSPFRLQGAPGANILIEGNKFDWNAIDDNSANAKLFLWTATYGQASGATIQGNSFINGELDGIHIGNGCSGDIIGNHFENICYLGNNHADMLQTEGMVGGRIAQNLFKAGLDCGSQALTSFDSGTVGVVIEDNVIDIRRPWGIEWFSDQNSIIRYNTLVWYSEEESIFNINAGQIRIDTKDGDPAGSGTQVLNNITTGVSFNNGSTGTSTGNVSGETAIFVGPLDTWAGYKLAPGSPVQGKGARIP